MSNTITLFASLTNPSLPELDTNFEIVSAQAPIPCTVSGTNSLTFTQIAQQSYTVTAYQQGMQLSGVAVATNNGASNAQLGSLAGLSIYKDSLAGPVLLAGGEIVNGCAFTLQYDSALSAGAGGWHLFASTANVGNPLNPSTLQFDSGSTLSRYFTTLASITLAAGAAATAQAVTIGLTGAVPGDNVLIGPPTTHPTGMALTGFVSATGSIVLTAMNVVSLASVAAAYRVSAFA